MTADELIDFLGIDSPGEIDVEAIAYSQNILVKYRPLDSCEAKIVGVGDKAVITVNSAQKNERRKRFSIAHEIGHWMNDRGKAFICGSGDIESRFGPANPESRANSFAADLLMPRSIAGPRISELPLTIEGAAELAEQFSTSLSATAIRMVQLSEAPAILAWYDQVRRIRFSRSASVPDEVWPVDRVDHETTAFENLFGNRGITAAEEVDADSWITHRDSHRYTLIESSVLVAPETLMVMIWWKNEAQILDLDQM